MPMDFFATSLPLFSSPTETLTLILLGVTLVAWILGGTLDLAFLLRLHPSTLFPAVRNSSATLVRRPWTQPEAALVMAVILWLFAPGAFQMLSPTDTHPDTPHTGGVLFQLGLLHILPLLLIAFRLRRSACGWRRAFATPAVSNGHAARCGFLYGLALILPAMAIAYAWRWVLASLHITVVPQPAIRWMLNPEIAVPLRILLIGMALVSAPVVEEVVLRGILLPVVARNRGPATAIVLVSLLFAAIHLNLVALAPLTLLGAGFALAYQRTGHLLTPIVMHMVINAFNIVALFAFHAVYGA